MLATVAMTLTADMTGGTKATGITRGITVAGIEIMGIIIAPNTFITTAIIALDTAATIAIMGIIRTMSG